MTILLFPPRLWFAQQPFCFATRGYKQVKNIVNKSIFWNRTTWDNSFYFLQVVILQGLIQVLIAIEQTSQAKIILF